MPKSSKTSSKRRPPKILIPHTVVLFDTTFHYFVNQLDTLTPPRGAKNDEKYA